MGILPSQTALLFHLIGEAVKADPLRGKRFLDEGRMAGYLPQKEGSERFNAPSPWAFSFAA
jgi:hypothetical protein